MDIYKLIMNTKDYYKELGVPRNALKSEIKSAYRLLAKKYHPDTGGSNEKFLAIQLAWETLSDPQKKLMYDKNLLFQENTESQRYEDWSLEIKNNSNSSMNKDKVKEVLKFFGRTKSSSVQKRQTKTPLACCLLSTQMEDGQTSLILI